MPLLAPAAALLAAAVDDGRLPAAVLEVGTVSGAAERLAFGAPSEAVFDLASLTKVLGTGVLATHLLGRRLLDPDVPVRALVPEWRGADRGSVRLRDLLAHASGLPAHLPLFERHRGSEAMVAACARAPLAHAPRTASTYSDLGFIVLGRVLEAITESPLDEQVHTVLDWLSDDAPRFGPRPCTPEVQATGLSPWRGRLLCGEVHDDNAAAMGGVAGHAGLFGTARGVGDIARAVLRGLQGGDSPLAPSWAVRAFARRSPVPGSSRALAWDTGLPTSSCGPYLSRQAIGHTGFTGTSVWIDPTRDLYVVLLTNRVAGRATSNDIADLRRAVHTAIGAAWADRS
ncbi:serine hydrolase [Luteitalea sp. TBR-22]|uniref:serine hydrolase domain-containing protein n=1 Tax=Luteitalea sp. TBR-22 TaxID=2802971 RepID=UPI001EF63206|nr:serine hydrolase domain-containing protein [Luteitalea sp. TBR-22]